MATANHWWTKNKFTNLRLFGKWLVSTHVVGPGFIMQLFRYKSSLEWMVSPKTYGVDVGFQGL